MDTSNRTITWIENLAEQELLIRAGEKSSIDICTTKDEVILVETSTFVRELFHHFSYLAKLFNLRINQENLCIKVEQLGSTEGFFLVRNGMRLMVESSGTGVVRFVGSKITAKGARPAVMFSGAVEAKFGTFNDVEWHFLGSSVTGEQLARHYLTEFIQVSRSTN